mmetsp:Transcript_4421/g.7891  ORF Transcript_4421/g.7891 Transcript_4421/m.7891 type:complete len:166 (+) Transcript_4421:116-613(+)
MRTLIITLSEQTVPSPPVFDPHHLRIDAASSKDYSLLHPSPSPFGNASFLCSNRGAVTNEVSPAPPTTMTPIVGGIVGEEDETTEEQEEEEEGMKGTVIAFNPLEDLPSLRPPFSHGAVVYRRAGNPSLFSDLYSLWGEEPPAPAALIEQLVTAAWGVEEMETGV